MEGLTDKLKFKWIGRWSKSESKLRLFCFTWATGMETTTEGWHSSSFAVSLWPKLFKVQPELWGWCVTVLGVRLHRKRAYGGWLR